MSTDFLPLNTTWHKYFVSSYRKNWYEMCAEKIIKVFTERIREISYLLEDMNFIKKVAMFYETWIIRKNTILLNNE